MKRAQSAATCSFDPGTATVTVSVNARPAALRAVKSTGAIELNHASCGGATVNNTDSIQVQGGALPDSVSLSGTFVPGLTSEATGDSEIEISFALGDRDDTVTVNQSGGDNRVILTTTGIDVKRDGDQDITTGGTEILIINGLGGDDLIDAGGYLGTPSGGRLELHGGEGADHLVATFAGTQLFGDAGDDLLEGRGGNDFLDGGPGNDVLRGQGGGDSMHGGDGDDLLYGGNDSDQMFGDAGADTLFGEGSLDTMNGGDGDDWLDGGDYIDHLTGGPGADHIEGGPGDDLVYYNERTAHVTVTIGNGLADDGEEGEGDEVTITVEDVLGSQGPNTLVGTDAENALYGGERADELYGGGGNDTLEGFGGADILVGDAGNDFIVSGAGPDYLEGGDGDDYLAGEGGKDVLDGGPGVDSYSAHTGDDTIYNDDGVAERVDCGDGIDDAEPDLLDTLVGCEL